MNIESVGMGAGGSAITAVLVWLGFKQRLDRADADIADLKRAVMYKDTHEVCSSAHNQQLIDMNKKLDYIITRVDNNP